jgi:hypothetical protein
MGRRNGRKPRRVGTAYEDHTDTNSKRETTVEKGRGRQRERRGRQGRRRRRMRIIQLFLTPGSTGWGEIR